MAGRRPNPKKVHQARGKPGKRKILETPEAPPGLIIPLPEVIADPLAKEEWDHIIADLERMQIARPLYRSILSFACIFVAKARRYLTELNRENLIVPGKQGPKLNPRFDAFIKTLNRMLPMLTECGLTPASTRRLHAPLPPPAEEAEQEREFFAEA